MKLIYLIAVIILLRLWFFYSKNCFTYLYSKKTRHALKLYHQAYNLINGYKISYFERQRLNLGDDSYVYGEIRPETLLELLKMLIITPGEVFYDLGCGTGKAVLFASFFYSWRKCCGVECLPALFNSCMQAKQALLNSPELNRFFPKKNFPINFIQQDILTIDFSDADVIFLHATTFHPTLWHPLKEKLNQLKKGTRIIVITKKLSEEYFEILNATKVIMSWGEAHAFLYRKKI